MFSRTALSTSVSALGVSLLLLVGAPRAHANHEPTDVSVTTTASPAGQAARGDNITYTITVMNAGTSSTDVITLSDVIPAGTTFVSLTGQFRYANAPEDDPTPGEPCATPPVGGTGTVTCLGSLEPTPLFDSTETFTLVVQVDPNAQGPITNTATATLADDPNLSNNSATVVTTLNPYPLAVSTPEPGKGAAAPESAVASSGRSRSLFAVIALATAAVLAQVGIGIGVRRRRIV